MNKEMKTHKPIHNNHDDDHNDNNDNNYNNNNNNEHGVITKKMHKPLRKKWQQMYTSLRMKIAAQRMHSKTGVKWTPI